MSDETPALISFLRARLDEDEQAAQAALRRFMGEVARWRDEPSEGLGHSAGSSVVWDGTGTAVVPHAHRFQGQHIARHDPARVLREVAAKRAIIADHPKGGHPSEPAGCGCGALWPCPTMRALASVYSDHPDYREEWRR